MFGVTMINKLHKDRSWYSYFLIFLGFGFSLFFLALAMRSISMGTAYAIWTGLGAAGGAILGIVFYNEPRDWKRILFITLILGAAVGLKIIE